MIDFIEGQVQYIEDQYIAVKTHGIGYCVFVPHPGRHQEEEKVFLYTHQVIREDAHLLYGFVTKDERDLFRLLLDVSGVGPKAGLAMISSGSPRGIIVAIQMEHVNFFTKMPGIGKKIAQRMILELKDKVQKAGLEERLLNHQPREPIPLPSTNSAMREAIEALVGLGYNEEEAQTLVQSVRQRQEDVELSTEEWIKQALQESMKA